LRDPRVYDLQDAPDASSRDPGFRRPSQKYLKGQPGPQLGRNSLKPSAAANFAYFPQFVHNLFSPIFAILSKPAGIFLPERTDINCLPEICYVLK
jgi:hypothetical protein